MKAVLILSFALITVFPSAAFAADPEPVFPARVTKAQLAILQRFSSSSEWFYVKDEEAVHKRLAPITKKHGLPRFARAEDLELTTEHIRNRAREAVLFILQHDTGADCAIRCHWLEPGASMPNRSIYVGLCEFRFPKLVQPWEKEKDSDKRDEESASGK